MNFCGRVWRQKCFPTRWLTGFLSCYLAAQMNTLAAESVRTYEAKKLPRDFNRFVRNSRRLCVLGDRLGQLQPLGLPLEC
jgi:hypothetical protein